MTASFDLLCEFAPGAGPFDVIDSHYLLTTGATNSYASTPDAASLDITGDIDVRVDVELDDWQQAGPNGQALAGKWNGTGNQRSWVLWVQAGVPIFSWSTDGTNANAHSLQATQPVPLTTGRITIRAALQVNLLGVSHSVAFYTSSSVDGSFTALGDLVTDTGTTSIFSSSANQFVAHIDNPDVALNAAGKFYAAQVRNGIGGTVAANPDFSAQAVGATSFADSTGKTWTVQADADIAGFDWVDLSDRLLSADWEIGRDDELDHFSAGEATVVLNNDDRQLDPDYTAGTWFGELLPRVPFRLRSVLPALDLPGAAGATATTPDHADFAITDLDVTIHLSMDDWTPAATQLLVGQTQIIANIGWSLSVTSTGLLSLQWSTDGTLGTVVTRNTTNAPGFTNGSDHTLRVTLDVNDGAGNRVVTFYVDGDVFETFTTAGTTSIHNSNQALTISQASLPLAGQVRDMQLLGSIGGSQIAAPDFMIQRPGTTSFVDSTTRTWTINGTATISVDTSTPFDEFYGFVDSGWEQNLEPPKRARCTIKLVDKLGILAGYDLPDVFHHAVLTLDPLRFWVMDGPSGSESVADMTGVGKDGTVVGSVTFGEPPVMPGHGTSARFDASTDEFGRVEISRSPLITDPSEASVVATFKARSAGTLNFRTLFIQSDGNGSTSTGVDALVDLTGRLNFTWLIDGGGITYETAASVVDGEGHIMFGQADGLAIDTAVLSTSTSSIAGATANGVGIGGYPGVQAADHWDGWICAVAVFDRLLIEQERELIHEGHEMLSGELSGAHIDWALDRLAVPAEHRDIADGTVVMGPADTDGRDALDWIRGVVATEQGGFYVDHRNGGKLRFTDRYHRFLDNRSTAAQEAFSDSPSSGVAVVRVERGELDVAPNGTDSIINQVTVNWRDGEETIEDSTSVVRYGPRPRQVTTEATTANQARSVAEWLIARYAQPRSRIRGLGIHPGGARRGIRTIYQLRIDDRVTHRLHPQQVGSATTTSLFVEGVRHAVEGLDWQTRYHLSPVDTFAPWIWGVSEWDTETFWG